MKAKYRFDYDTLRYEKLEVSASQVIRSFLKKFTTSLLFGTILFLLLFLIIATPRERMLQEQNAQILFQYHLLNKRLDNTFTTINKIQESDNDSYRPFFEMKTISNSIRKAGFGGSNVYKSFEGYENSKIVIQVQKKLDIISKQLYVQTKSHDEIIKMILDKEKMLEAIPSIRPVKKSNITSVGTFGMRFHPILHYERMHKGIDLCADEGTKIYASGSGIVVRSKFNSGLGDYIVIDHGYGYKSVYGHVSKVFVKVGKKVKRGDIIAEVGTTGLSYVNHLHYEVHKNGKPVNPFKYYYYDLTDKEYNNLKGNHPRSKAFFLNK